MDVSLCKHLRVRDRNDYTMDIEKFIKSIEMQFKIDFTSLPQWKELIEMMNIVQTDYNTKIKNASNRKYEIIRNIYMQNTRRTPFELTDKFARTSKIWEDIKHKLRKRRVSKVDDNESLIISCDDMIDTPELIGEVSPNLSTAHPNTEVQSKHLLDGRPDTELDLQSPNSSHLPLTVCTNQHKMISPLGSTYAPFEILQNEISNYELKYDTTKENLLLPTYTKLVKSYPTEIIISNNTPKKQAIKLFLTNCCTEFLHLRFKNISVSSYFTNIEIIPCTSIKLCPGLTAVYKFKYSLKNQNIENVTSSLHFKVSRNIVFSESFEEVLCIPIVSDFMKSNTIAVTETVYIPPNYSWHITPELGYPKAVVHIKNTDDACYSLHIRKRNVDFTKVFDESNKSIEVISPDSESLDQRNEDKELQNIIISTPNIQETSSKHFEKINDDNVNSVDIVVLLLGDLIDLALEPFIFKQTCLRISPRSRKFVYVYFTKVHHIGYHQSYYDFIFTDFKGGDFTITKTTKVFAEVLPHPITLHPKILDMSKSPVTFGYREDYFKITNSHKVFPVMVKITTTTKMRKLFNITPMDSYIPSQSSVDFYVKICSTKNIHSVGPDDLAYFTIKILFIGHKSVYKNIPPMYYEIIAPCGTELKQVYGTKYFSDSSEIDVSDLPNSCENLYV